MTTATASCQGGAIKDSVATCLPDEKEPAAPPQVVQRNILRYAFAVVSSMLALGVGLLAQHYGIHQQYTFFLFAIALTAWFRGAGPAIVAVVCSSLAFNYFFLEPFYTLTVRPKDMPDYMLFILFGLLVGWFGDARRRVENALRLSDKKYRGLIDAAPDAIIVWDAQGKCVLSNDSAARLRGCSKNEMFGLAMADTYAAAEREQVRERLELVRAQGILRFERQFVRRNGEAVPVEVSLSPADGGQYQAVLRDISAGKRAEEILRERASLLDLTHDVIFVRDMNNIITYWNRGAEQLHGWMAEEVVGKVRKRELLKTIFPAPLDEIDAELLRTGRWEGELIHTKRDGTQIVVASRWSLQRDARGAPVSVLETHNDITKRKQAEEALRRTLDELEFKVKERTSALSKSNADLESVNKELEAFAYSVSHDLRAPVRHIAGFTVLLQKHSEAVLDETSRDHFSMILDSAKRMGALVDDLLAYSRIGRAEAQETTVHLEQVIKSVVGEIAPDTQGRDIVWRIGALPICRGDPSMLRLVFANLVSNAAKFTRTRAQARIEIDSMNGKPDEMIVFVRDNGVGFNMKYKNKLFGVFQRLHSQEAFEGTGIGLATVQRIVHRHGGRVWAEGSIENGATFYVALPNSGENNI